MNLINLRKEILDAHNYYRNLHSIPILKYSNDLEKSAQTWALNLSNQQILAYSPVNTIFSENVAEIRNVKNLKGVQIIEAWYSQRKNFDYVKYKHSGPIDQFCVLIWAGSHTIGIGLAKSIDNKLFVVVHYSPPGFQCNDFKENIRPVQTCMLQNVPRSLTLIEAIDQNCEVIKKSKLESFQIDSLTLINVFRIQHGAPKLTLNEELCQAAELEAGVWAISERLMKQNSAEVGVTYLALKQSDFITAGGMAVKQWYAESIGYEYNEEPITDQYNNFTQLIWFNTKEFGIGVSATVKGLIYIVGCFLPRGNRKKKYIENIFPPNTNNLTCYCYNDFKFANKFSNEFISEYHENRTLMTLTTKNHNQNINLVEPEIMECKDRNWNFHKPPKIVKKSNVYSHANRIDNKSNTILLADHTSQQLFLTTNVNNVQTKRSVLESKSIQGRESKNQKLNLDYQKMREILLKSHNTYRELHTVPVLLYSEQLEKSAQSWAQTLSEVLILTYSPESEIYAENCAEIRNPFDFETNEITDLWYSQEKNYDYENFNHTGSVDQFCVMIWKESVKVGFGIAISNDQRVFVVAHYSPPGLTGNFEDNVKPSKFYIKPSEQTKPFVPLEATSKSYKSIKKEELKDFQIDALGKLNNFRLRHNSPALKLNENLCATAFDQAKRCATNRTLLSSNDKSCGETFLELKINKFSITGGLSPRHWYGESVGYDFNKEPENDQYHNFTQLVWKGSQEMGIGVAASTDGILFVIGKYLPPGNIKNQYLANVLSPKEEKKFCQCGCGYVAPACIQDLKTTVIAKLPSLLSNLKSHNSRFGNSVRSFSVIDNINVKNEEAKNTVNLKPINDSQIAKPKSITKDSSIKDDILRNLSKDAEIMTNDNLPSIKTKDTLRSIPEVTTGSNLGSVKINEQSNKDAKISVTNVKEAENRSFKENQQAKKSDKVSEIGRSKIDSVKKKDLSIQNSEITRQSSEELINKGNIENVKQNLSKTSDVVRSKIGSIKTKDSSIVVPEISKMSTKGVTDASVKESLRAKESGLATETIRSKIESIKTKDTSIVPPEISKMSTKEVTNVSVKESVKAKESGVATETIRSKIESVKTKDTSILVPEISKMSTREMTNVSVKDSVKAKESIVATETIRSKIESIRTKDTSILVPEISKMSTREMTNVSVKDSVKAKESGVATETIPNKIGSIKTKDTSIVVPEISKMSTKGVTDASVKESLRAKESGVATETIRSKIESIKAKDTSILVPEISKISTREVTNVSFKDSVKAKESGVATETIRSKIESIKTKDTSIVIPEISKMSTKEVANISVKESLKAKESAVATETIQSKIDSVKIKTSSTITPEISKLFNMESAITKGTMKPNPPEKNSEIKIKNAIENLQTDEPKNT